MQAKKKQKESKKQSVTNFTTYHIYSTQTRYIVVDLFFRNFRHIHVSLNVFIQNEFVILPWSYSRTYFPF